METLRSPKTLSGPALGIGALTFRQWFTAQWGTQAWEALDKIPREMWMAYLVWYRRALGLPIENEVEVTQVTPQGDLLHVALAGAGSRETSLLCRRVVLATGRDGMGAPNIPGFVSHLPRGTLWAHSSDALDFKALAGKKVGVVGVGASAVDNAAEALEAGCAECRLLIRRAEMPTVNKMMGIGSYGLTAGFPDLPDDWRWRLMRYSFVTQTPAPRGSTLRVSRHTNAYFHFGAGIEDLRRDGDRLHLRVSGGRQFDLDFLILGTGFTVEPEKRTELGPAATDVRLWRDAYTPPPDETHDELGLFPYLNPDFSFQERVQGSAPWLRRVHCFNFGSTLSMGKVSGDIPAVSEGGAFLARALASAFYNEDIAHHWKTLQAYEKPELLGDEWRPAD
jgi:cation diffusion facilitator CzcD-associated flavoprotein CzcO